MRGHSDTHEHPDGGMCTRGTCACPDMHVAAVLVVLAAAVLAGAEAQCPAPSNLRTANGTHICAQLYTDNSPYYDQCCGSPPSWLYPGSDVPYMPPGWVTAVSSLVVGTRCELTVWSRASKKGKSRSFGASTVPRLQEVRRGLFGNWNNTIRGFYCQCR
ncbi:LOW QUALITY PROTEIN: syncollin [Harpia harpyja]|uniref:LOW QUALITY PROTEIN: syncollin n=1 Tax=Harpia harpyja TaxID=202280 RepID=UPI0022B147C8|nr:LOW QUALITY PROTEIN: syncollin [Harpia harpyja]